LRVWEMMHNVFIKEAKGEERERGKEKKVKI
jgi:hypothetical protein